MDSDSSTPDFKLVNQCTSLKRIEQVKQFRHHSKTVLNCPEPTTLQDVHYVPTTKLDKCLNNITVYGISDVIRMLKSNKAACIESLSYS